MDVQAQRKGNTVSTLFEELLLLQGRRRAKNFYDVGAWDLDVNLSMGGVAIVEVTSVKGGVKRVTERQPEAQFITSLRMAIALLHEAEAYKRKGAFN